MYIFDTIYMYMFEIKYLSIYFRGDIPGEATLGFNYKLPCCTTNRGKDVYFNPEQEKRGLRYDKKIR